LPVLVPADKVGEAITAFNKKAVAFGIPGEVAGFEDFGGAAEANLYAASAMPEYHFPARV
jgi:hypothetical protein